MYRASEAELEQYERLNDDDWLHVHRAHAGRKYRVERISEQWLTPGRPDQLIARVDLVESDREDDSVLALA